MNILLLDIETAPNLAYVWGLFNQNIGINQIANSGYVLCWSAKWLGQEQIHFSSIKKHSPEAMLERIHRMMDRADAIITYNGKKFDVPTLYKEFITHGMTPPAPAKQIDLYKNCKRTFRFPSNKLDYIAQTLGLGEKVRHEGHELWVKCMAGDREAWKRMEAYNKQDVLLLEKLYEKLLPWIDNHPNRGAFEDVATCTNCGGQDYQQRGYAVTRSLKYPRYQCKDCGTWFRGNKNVSLPREKHHSITT